MEFGFSATMAFRASVTADTWEEAYELFMDNLREYHKDTIDWVEVQEED